MWFNVRGTLLTHCVGFLVSPKDLRILLDALESNTPVDEVMTSIGGGSGSLRFYRRTDTGFSRKKIRGISVYGFRDWDFCIDREDEHTKVQDKNRM